MDNNLLGNEQYGFRSIHSTALALNRASNNWLINTDNSSLNSIVFLGTMPSLREITCGVPQASIREPLLFMNDLPLSVKEANITMYADDTSLSKPIRGIQNLKEQLIPTFIQVCK